MQELYKPQLVEAFSKELSFIKTGSMSKEASPVADLVRSIIVSLPGIRAYSSHYASRVGRELKKAIKGLNKLNGVNPFTKFSTLDSYFEEELKHIRRNEL